MALSRAVASGRLIQLRRGAFTVPRIPETGHQLARLRLGQRGVAVALLVRRATVSHGAAIAVHGLPLLRTPDDPCVTLPPEFRTREAAIHLHRQPILPWQLASHLPLPVTSVARSCIDHTRESGLEAGVVAADAALHQGQCSIEELALVYATCKGRAGLPSGRKLLELVDASAESPLESVSRLSMRELQPAPRTQVSLHSAAGQFLARVDFYWSELGVVGEADGREKYTDDELWKEKLRQDRLVDHGLVIERWGWPVAMRPAVLQSRLEGAFRRAAGLRSAGIPITAHPR